mmetsp:Transcript_137901/g.384559  ORF Transcript_137901/g.384559 Transcript_137901/m.384559 type:complete len:530 (+) Transcript_137901:110-1699(+)
MGLQGASGAWLAVLACTPMAKAVACWQSERLTWDNCCGNQPSGCFAEPFTRHRCCGRPPHTRLDVRFAMQLCDQWGGPDALCTEACGESRYQELLHALSKDWDSQGIDAALEHFTAGPRGTQCVPGVHVVDLVYLLRTPLGAVRAAALDEFQNEYDRLAKNLVLWDWLDLLDSGWGAPIFSVLAALHRDSCGRDPLLRASAERRAGGRHFPFAEENVTVSACARRRAQFLTPHGTPPPARATRPPRACSLRGAAGAAARALAGLRARHGAARSEAEGLVAGAQLAYVACDQWPFPAFEGALHTAYPLWELLARLAIAWQTLETPAPSVVVAPPAGAQRRVFLLFGAMAGLDIEWLCQNYPGGSSYEVFAFEPNPANRDRLMNNLVRYAQAYGGDGNKALNVTVLPKAVWDHDGTALFRWDLSAVNAHGFPGGKLEEFSDVPAGTGQQVEVEVIDVAPWLNCTVHEDDYVVAKVDVEGAEYDLVERIISAGQLRLIDEITVEWGLGQPSRKQRLEGELIRTYGLRYAPLT